MRNKNNKASFDYPEGLAAPMIPCGAPFIIKSLKFDARKGQRKWYEATSSVYCSK